MCLRDDIEGCWKQVVGWREERIQEAILWEVTSKSHPREENNERKHQSPGTIYVLEEQDRRIRVWAERSRKQGEGHYMHFTFFGLKKNEIWHKVCKSSAYSLINISLKPPSKKWDRTLLAPPEASLVPILLSKVNTNSDFYNHNLALLVFFT